MDSKWKNCKDTMLQVTVSQAALPEPGAVLPAVCLAVRELSLVG